MRAAITASRPLNSLTSIDPQYPVFVLAFCLFDKEKYAEKITTNITHLKFKYFGHDQVILHEREIRKEEAAFSILRREETRNEFHGDVSGIVREAPLTIFASVIDKRRLKKEHDDPANPYHLAMAFGLERLYMHLSRKGCDDGKLHIVFEERGDKEDRNLELEFRRVLDGRVPIIVEKSTDRSGDKKGHRAALGLELLTTVEPNPTSHDDRFECKL
jgi:hypothetical protein